jgi:hypothetical protein
LRALHLNVFEQPSNKEFFNNPSIKPSLFDLA